MYFKSVLKCVENSHESVLSLSTLKCFFSFFKYTFKYTSAHSVLLRVFLFHKGLVGHVDS